MIGVAIPAHDEEARIGAAVLAVQRAASHPLLHGEPVRIVVVADACRDATLALAGGLGAATLEARYCNVGLARRAGAEFLLAEGARWLAFTDADSVVADDWLVQQLAARSDAVCGCVSVEDWSVHGAAAQRLAERFRSTYVHADGHRHVHGANLGVSAEAYAKAGGFAPLAAEEDVALVRALEAAGCAVAYSAAPHVVTSARLDHRAPWGFGAALALQAQALLAGAC